MFDTHQRSADQVACHSHLQRFRINVIEVYGAPDVSIFHPKLYFALSGQRKKLSTIKIVAKKSYKVKTFWHPSHAPLWMEIPSVDRHHHIFF
ncbi:MAG: hypothetical protein LV471_04580 [Nitrosomonas sp.]|nr:hypothetical protein [Nitrosomonas sp.]